MSSDPKLSARPCQRKCGVKRNPALPNPNPGETRDAVYQCLPTSDPPNNGSGPLGPKGSGAGLECSDRKAVLIEAKSNEPSVKESTRGAVLPEAKSRAIPVGPTREAVLKEAKSLEPSPRELTQGPPSPLGVVSPYTVDPSQARRGERRIHTPPRPSQERVEMCAVKAFSGVSAHGTARPRQRKPPFYADSCGALKRRVKPPEGALSRPNIEAHAERVFNGRRARTSTSELETQGLQTRRRRRPPLLEEPPDPRRPLVTLDYPSTRQIERLTEPYRNTIRVVNFSDKFNACNHAAWQFYGPQGCMVDRGEAAAREGPARTLPKRRSDAIARWEAEGESLTRKAAPRGDQRTMRDGMRRLRAARRTKQSDSDRKAHLASLSSDLRRQAQRVAMQIALSAMRSAEAYAHHPAL